MSDVRQWLESLGLGQYADAFERNDVDAEILAALDHELLQQIGVSSVGHRVKIIKAAGSAVPQEFDSELRNATPSASQTTPSPVPFREAERRQLTVMFCDLVGSVELGEQLDLEDYRDLLGRFRKAVVGAVERSNGFVARHQGDGVLVYFGYPQAHEEDAQQAVRAGLDIVQSVKSLEHPYEVTAAVRVGIATGTAVVGDLLETGASSEQAALGQTPNLAARLQGEAQPNSVVISDTTKALTAGLFEFEALPARAVKGISDPVTPYQVLTEVRGQSRFAARSGSHLSPFVGREEELELLTRRWSRTKAGRGQVVLTVGEAGIGKSRLMQQLREHIGTDPHETISVQCSPYHESSALYPVISAFERELEFAQATTEGAHRLVALQRHLAATAKTDEQTLGLLAHLLSIPTEGVIEAMDTARRRERTLQALVDYVRKRAERAPLLCAFEDVHWADPTTRELLGRLVEAIESESVLLIATTRTGFEAQWADLAHVQVLSLSRLGPEAGVELARAVASTMAGLSNVVVEAVLSRAEGNPLYIEELTRTMAQSAESVTPNRGIPATLQDSLMARLDASQIGKNVAQCAAVIGREFKQHLLSKVWEGSSKRLTEGLNALDQAGLILRRGEGGLAQYIFKHALIRDTAYASLLRESRMNLHARVAASIEALDPEIRTNEPELLARHYTEAGLTEQALDRWLDAAERAGAHSAFAECVAHVASALPLLEDIPSGRGRDLKEIDLHLARALAERAIRGDGSNEAGEAYARARDLGERLGDAKRLFTALEGIHRYYRQRFDVQQSHAAAERMRTIGKENDEPHMLASGYALTAGDFITEGNLLAARENYELALSACKETDFEVLSAMAIPLDASILRGLTWTYANIGYFDRSLKAAEEAVRLVERRGGNLQHICDARWAFNGALLMRYDYQRLLDEAPRLHAAASIGGFRFHQALGDLHSAVALGGLGQLVDAIELVLKAKAGFESLGIPMTLNHLYWSPAAIYLAHAGRFKDAIDLASEALSASSSHFRPWALMRMGEVLRLAGDCGTTHAEESAESHLQEALALARERSAKGWEVEAAMSLAILWRNQGKRQQAHHLLVPLYEWFTEGHDAGILKKAKALLDELS